MSFKRLSIAGILLIISLMQIQAAPINDNFADRIILNGTNVTVNGSNGGASTEPGEDTGSAYVLWFYSVWYGWTAPTNGVVHFSGNTSAYGFFMSIRAYRGNAVNALTLAPATPDGGVPVTTGDTIAIQVATVYYPLTGSGGGTGPFSLTLALEVPAPTSPNDSFAARLDITTPTYHFDGSVYGATNEPGEPLPNPMANQTLWWRFVAPEDCVLNVSVSAPEFSPAVRVYDGSSLQTLASVAAIHDSFYRLLSGREYAVQMATGYVPGGGFSIDTKFYSLSNDMFTGATRLEGTNFTFYGNFTAATAEPNEPPQTATNSVWLAWAAPCTGRVRYNVATTYAFQYCTPYLGPNLAHLQQVTVVGLGNRVMSFLAIEGTVYYFQLSGGADNFTFNFSMDCLGQCTNDNFDQAQLLKGQVLYFEPKSVMGATMEPGEPDHMDGIPQKSIWWKWQAPLSGSFYVSAAASTVTNVVLGFYSGKAVEALTLVGKATTTLNAPVVGGETYYLAGAVPTNAIGDIACYAQLNGSSAGRIVPGNLLQEPSWEGTAILGAQYWHWSGGLGGYVNEAGGCDGSTWPELGGGTTIWQDIPTISGHQYLIHFAYLIGGNLSGCCGDANVQVLWDTNELGNATIPDAESRFWHWADFTATASNSTSRVSFKNLARNLEMDAFSVVDLSAPPGIVNQPASISTVAGGTAAFIVGVTGSAPLSFQWWFSNTPLPAGTAHTLVLNSASTDQAGNYFVTISNVFGAVTSAPASLYVDATTYPTIVWEPYGDTVAVGCYYGFNVGAIGSEPLRYQWFLNGQVIDSATNKSLVFASVQTNNAGTYQIAVNNSAGTVWSLPATLRVSETNSGGGFIDFANFSFCGNRNLDAPIFDVDQYTKLSGSGYLAQLYAGPSLALLRPAGQPSRLLTGFEAGYFDEQFITLANIAPGAEAVIQVRAWEAAKGDTYDQARALGGKFGKSEVLTVIPTGAPQVPQCLSGLNSFSLQAGLPKFTVGVIQFVERLPQNTIVWAVVGQSGSRYVVEKSSQDLVWKPFVVLTNVSGTVTFTDSANSSSGVAFYRARILD